MDRAYELSMKLIAEDIKFEDIDFGTEDFLELSGMYVGDISFDLIKKYLCNVPKEGTLYCEHNEMYLYYGDNVYKLGCSVERKNEGKDNIRPYVVQSSILYESEKVNHCGVAERLLFGYLKENRIKDDKQFFRVELDNVKTTIQKVVNEINGDLNKVLENNRWIIDNYECKEAKIIRRVVTEISKQFQETYNRKLR